jgi:aspartate ammonia-lyase
MYRIEKDSLGEKKIPGDALYGIHALRAKENFPGNIQMQEAVPSSYGMLFSTYNETLSRDWWRVSKCFESINLLLSADYTLLNNLFSGLVINETEGYIALLNSPSVTTVLSPHIGYHIATELAILMKEKKINIFEANVLLNVIDEKKLERLLQPANLLKLGFSLEDFNI